MVHPVLRGADQLYRTGRRTHRQREPQRRERRCVVQALAAAAILLSWLLLHTAFAQIYAREHAGEGGLDYPNCPVPQLTEFLYFATTIGTSFAVSDVTVTTRSMRRRVLVHSIVSFSFNAALIAIAIDWIKS